MDLNEIDEQEDDTLRKSTTTELKWMSLLPIHQ